jgi:spermidine/putrescine transport system permease protein
MDATGAAGAIGTGSLDAGRLAAADLDALEAAEADLGGRRPRGGSWRRRLSDTFLWLVASLVLLFLFAPIFVIVLLSFNEPLGRYNFAWNQFSLNAWTDPFKYPQLTQALQTSLTVAAVSTAVAVVLGTFVAVALVRRRFRGSGGIDLFLVLPLTAPEIVIGASLLTLFLDLGWNRGFGTIVVAHISFQVAFVAMTVKARVRGFDWTLEDAALDLGANPTRTFLRVTLPLILPGIIAAAMLSFALSLDDFIITFFTAGAETTYPLYVNAAVKNGLPPQVNVLATAILVISLLLLVASSLWRRRRLPA